MLIIYRKSDGAVLGNSGTNNLLPDGPKFEDEVKNIIRKYGGKAENYGEYRINDKENAVLVRAILGAESCELEYAGGKPVGVTNIKARVIVPPEPKPDPDAELAGAIEAATTLQELKDALLGKYRAGKVKGKPV